MCGIKVQKHPTMSTFNFNFFFWETMIVFANHFSFHEKWSNCMTMMDQLALLVWIWYKHMIFVMKPTVLGNYAAWLQWSHARSSLVVCRGWIPNKCKLRRDGILGGVVSIVVMTRRNCSIWGRWKPLVDHSIDLKAFAESSHDIFHSRTQKGSEATLI